MVFALVSAGVSNRFGVRGVGNMGKGGFRVEVRFGLFLFFYS